MRGIGRWLFGPEDEHELLHKFRAIPIVLVLAPGIIWIRDDQAPSLDLWLECFAGALVAFVLLNWRPRLPRRHVDHRVEITEHHPPPGQDWLPYATAECSCGWTEGEDKSLAVTRHLARKHSNTGEPRVVRG